MSSPHAPQFTSRHGFRTAPAKRSASRPIRLSSSAAVAAVICAGVVVMPIDSVQAVSSNGGLGKVQSMVATSAPTKTVSANTGGPRLNIRAAASTKSKVLYTVANKSKMRVRCYVRGQSLSGGVYNVKNDGLWYKISGKTAYAWDGALETRSNNPVVPKCGSVAKPSSAVYYLPFKKGSRYEITQGPKQHGAGKYPEYNRHAVDFGTPWGTPVLASRAGKVQFEGYGERARFRSASTMAVTLAASTPTSRAPLSIRARRSARTTDRLLGCNRNRHRSTPSLEPRLLLHSEVPSRNANR